MWIAGRYKYNHPKAAPALIKPSSGVSCPVKIRYYINGSCYQEHFNRFDA